MKKQKVSASALPRRKVIKASKSTADMLNAFEDKLAEFGIESSTEIKGSEDVEIYGEDYHEKYEDVGGGFGDTGKVYSLAEIKEYWNENRHGDPLLEVFDSFDRWWRNTRDNFMEPVFNCDNVEASIRNSIELDDLQEERLWEIAERYNTSDPVSGDWDTEVEHERQAIADELGLTLREAQMVMMDELGFTRDQFDLK